MTADLTAEAELVLEGDSGTYRGYDEHDRLVVDAPSLSALRGLADLRTALPVGDENVGSKLATAGLAVDLRVRRATVARLGSGVDGGPVGRWLTGTDAALDPTGVATAAVRALG